MKQTKLALVVVGALVCLVGLTSWAWAGGAGGVLACCVADRLGIGHIELEGTIAVVYTPGYYCLVRNLYQPTLTLSCVWKRGN